VDARRHRADDRGAGALPGDRTRLLVRTRANYAPRSLRLLVLPLGLVDATYGVAMLRAIARRAETIDSAAG
jgi:hypothetical protein